MQLIVPVSSGEDTALWCCRRTWVLTPSAVCVPLLYRRSEIVESGLLPSSVFLTGFALIGCVPGPMFNLAPFLGAAIGSWTGAALATTGLFSPGIMLLLGVLPFWEKIRRMKGVRNFISGVNSAAAGLIVAGVWMLLKRTMAGPASFAMAVSAAISMLVYGVQAPVAIVMHGLVGAIFVYFGIGGPFKGA